MTAYTDAKDALLFGLAKSLRDSGRPDPQHIQRLIIAAQSTAEPDQPKPSEQKERDAKTAYIRSVQRSAIFVCPAKDRALSHNEEACENCDCIGLSSEPKPQPTAPIPTCQKHGIYETLTSRCHKCAEEEPKPSAGAIDLREAAREAMKAYLLNDTLSTEARFRRAVEAAAPYICAGKDADTATVIADNDAKMAKIERWKQAFNDANRQIFEVCEDRDAKMAKIERLKKIIEGANDIDAATKRLRARYPYLAIEECLGMARAVYGMESCNK